MEGYSAYGLILLVSLAGNTVIGIIVYNTKTMRKPINFFIVKMAMSDLLIPILTMLHLGRALCKLVVFFTDTSALVSIQSLVLIAVDGSIWSCRISPPYITHQFKAVPVLHTRHLDRCYGYTLPISLRHENFGISRRVGVLDALERSIWSLLKITSCHFRSYSFLSRLC